MQQIQVSNLLVHMDEQLPVCGLHYVAKDMLYVSIVPQETLSFVWAKEKRTSSVWSPNKFD